MSPFSPAKVPVQSSRPGFNFETQCMEQIMVTEAESREIRRYFIATQAIQVHEDVA